MQKQPASNNGLPAQANNDGITGDSPHASAPSPVAPKSGQTKPGAPAKPKPMAKPRPPAFKPVSASKDLPKTLTAGETSKSATADSRASQGADVATAPASPAPPKPGPSKKTASAGAVPKLPGSAETLANTGAKPPTDSPVAAKPSPSPKQVHKSAATPYSKPARDDTKIKFVASPKPQAPAKNMRPGESTVLSPEVPQTQAPVAQPAVPMPTPATDASTTQAATASTSRISASTWPPATPVTSDADSEAPETPVPEGTDDVVSTDKSEAETASESADSLAANHTNGQIDTSAEPINDQGSSGLPSAQTSLEDTLEPGVQATRAKIEDVAPAPEENDPTEQRDQPAPEVKKHGVVLSLLLGVSFVLEVALLGAAALGAMWAMPQLNPVVAVAIVVIPLMVFWGLFMSPKASFRIASVMHAVLAHALFIGGSLLLLVAGQPILAIVMGTLTAVSLGLTLFVGGQGAVTQAVQSRASRGGGPGAKSSGRRAAR